MPRTFAALLLMALAACGGEGPSDIDGDGFPAGVADCDDEDPLINPAAEEISSDGVDNDCDGRVDPPPAISWSLDVAPILGRRCVGCHQPGGLAPFSLMAYEDAAPLAAAIVNSVESGRMPPWLPSDACLPLADARVVTDAERSVLRAWEAEGAPEGVPQDEAMTPPPPAELEWVDLELAPDAPYTTQVEGGDDYRCFVLHPDLTEEAYLIGLKVTPGARSIVHHILLFESEDAEHADLKDAEAEGPGYPCFGSTGLPAADLIGNGNAGAGATRYPANTGIRLAPGGALVMQVHYNTAIHPPEEDLTTVQLQLSRDRVERPARLVTFGDFSFEIPANTFGYEVTASFTVPSDLVLYGFTPHMHLAGTRITDTYVSQDQQTCLVDIPQWDFGWQQAYFLSDPEGFPLHEGDEIRLSCRYDNPTDVPITFGESTTDEMCITYLYLVP